MKMKKSYLLLVTLALMNVSFGQTKSSGIVSLRTGADLTTIKIDLNQTTSTVTMTMVGPSSRWFSVGFNTISMSSNTDVFTSAGTQVLDQVLPGGQIAPNTDTTNNLTVESNTVSGTSRTVVVTRPFNTGDSKDFTFNYASNSLNIIWAFGPDTNISNEHDRFGSKALTFTPTLGTEDFASLDKISISPNPSNGIFNISKNSAIQISKIRIFDTNAKLLKEIEQDVNRQENTVDLSSFNIGLYFMEISNKEDKIVKKIILK
jgi:hypothetical protein